MEYVKKLDGYEKHHEPSSTGGLMNLLINQKVAQTIKLDSSDAPSTGVFSYKKSRTSKKFHYYIPIILQKIGYVVFFVLHHLFVRIEIRGRENLENITGPIILAANHTGEFDVTAMPLIFSFFSSFFPIYFITNPTEKYQCDNDFGWRKFIYGGLFFNTLGGYPVYSGHKNYAISLQNHVNLLRKGNTICMFPEGRMTLDGNLGKARGGLGYLVHLTDAMVVPVAINTFYNMSWKKYFGFKRKVTITVCKPISRKEIIDMSNPTVEDYRAAGQKVLDRIQEKLVTK